MFARNDSTGKFVKGTTGGPGNPYAKKALHFKTLIMNSVTDEELVTVVKALVAQAMNGNVRAAQELLDRVAGRPEQTFVDNTPEKPPITMEAFEEAMVKLGWVKSVSPSNSETGSVVP